MPTGSELEVPLYVLLSDGTVYRSTSGSTILSGTATPTTSVGSDRDYYLDTDDNILYGPKNSSAIGYGSNQFVYTSTPSNVTGAVTGTFASRVQVAVDGRITGIRYYRHSSSGASHTLRLWKEDGTQLGSSTTTGESGAGWVTATLATPVAVTAGQYVRASLDVTSDYFFNQTPYTTYTNGDLSIAGPSYWTGGTVGVYPNTADTSFRYFIDVVFQKTVTTAVWPVAVSSGVAKTGDTMSGDLSITKTDPGLILNSVTPSERYVRFRTGGEDRWTFGAVPSDEEGGNSGSDFSIARWTDDGSWIDNPIIINRMDGTVTVLKPLWLADGTPTDNNHAASKWYVDQKPARVYSGPITSPPDPADFDQWVVTP